MSKGEQKVESSPTMVMPQGAATEENNVAAPPEVKHEINTRSLDSLLRCILKRLKNGHSNKYMFTHVHSSTIHNHKKVETTISLSRDEWTKECVDPYNTVLSSYEKA